MHNNFVAHLAPAFSFVRVFFVAILLFIYFLTGHWLHLVRSALNTRLRTLERPKIILIIGNWQYIYIYRMRLLRFYRLSISSCFANRQIELNDDKKKS